MIIFNISPTRNQMYEKHKYGKPQHPSSRTHASKKAMNAELKAKLTETLRGMQQLEAGLLGFRAEGMIRV